MKIMTQDRERICEFGDAWVMTHGGGSSIVMWNGVYLGTYNEKNRAKEIFKAMLETYEKDKKIFYMPEV